ncbi:MAG: hypothetical protein ACJ77N_08945 [Chloroflexota bacterium]
MTHPSLGLPPPNLTAGFPDAAKRLRTSRERLAARALEIAIDADASLTDRYDEVGLRKLLRDAAVLLDRLALSVAGGDPGWLRDFAEQIPPIYRRRRVPLDDVIVLLEGIRAASRAVLSPDEMTAADPAIDGAINVLRWNRRIAGDARKRNRILAALYKGA